MIINNGWIQFWSSFAAISASVIRIRIRSTWFLFAIILYLLLLFFWFGRFGWFQNVSFWAYCVICVSLSSIYLRMEMKNHTSLSIKICFDCDRHIQNKSFKCLPWNNKMCWSLWKKFEINFFVAFSWFFDSDGHDKEIYVYIRSLDLAFLWTQIHKCTDIFIWLANISVYSLMWLHKHWISTSKWRKMWRERDTKMRIVKIHKHEN